MYCNKCGAELSPGASVCPKCGQGNTNAPSAQIKTYLPQSILVTLFCCLPFGIVSIVYAAKVSGLVTAGQIAEAKVASDSARKWATWGFTTGLIINILTVVLQVIAATL